MSRLKSQNVVSYKGSGLARTGDVFWIEMELICGDPLDKILENHGPLPEDEVIKVIHAKGQRN